MMPAPVVTRGTLPITICAGPHAKLIGTLDGTFPDMGHHSEREMAGLWMHPIKVLDGFWLRFHDLDAPNVDTWALADECVQEPDGDRFFYRHGLGHTPVVIERRQYCPYDVPGLLVEYLFTSHSDAPRHIVIDWRARTDLYPSWFALDTGAYEDGQDTGHWDGSDLTFTAEDDKNPWCVLIRPDRRPDAVTTGDLATPQGSGRGTCLSLMYHVLIPARGTWALRLRITGSFEGKDKARRTLEALTDIDAAREADRERLHKTAALSVLTTGDPAVDEPWAWVKAHNDWLTVDAGPFGRGQAAGLPEYPWWFGCDTCYAAQGLLCVGRFDLVKETLKLLADYSSRVNGNGRVVHEITPFGLCPNPGNTQETAHFVTAVWHFHAFTGDRKFVEEMLPFLRQCMAWLDRMDDDGDMLPSGYGIIEIRGLNAEMIDTAAYTAQAWECFADMLALCGREEEAASAREKHRRVREALNTVLWDDRAGSYCDACASPEFVARRMGQILNDPNLKMTDGERRAWERSLELGPGGPEERGFIINRNWTVFTPMESGQADEDKARRALENPDNEALYGPWGVYLNAVDREWAMTISTGCAAAALARFGYADRALDLIERMLGTFSRVSPGMISEMSPDGGCAVQGWTAYALFVPVVRYFFGIRPAGEKGRLTFAPSMPRKWTKAALDRVRLPGGYLSVSFKRTPAGEEYTLTADHALRARIRSPRGLNCPEETLELLPGVPRAVVFRGKDNG